MWEEILKAKGQANATKRAIEKSVKTLINEFMEDKAEVDRRDVEQYIRDNLLNRVRKDGHLVQLIPATKIKTRTKAYLKQRLGNYMITKWTRYITMQGFDWDRNKNVFTPANLQKAKLPAVKTEKYQLYVVFIKKILKKEGGAAGMKNFLEEGRKMKGFDERYLNYVIDDAIDNDNWLAEHEYGDYYLKE